MHIVALLCFFCPLLKIYSGNPYLKILDLAKRFVSDAPFKKKLKNYLISDHFEMWVWKSPMHERVKNYIVRFVLSSKFAKSQDKNNYGNNRNDLNKTNVECCFSKYLISKGVFRAGRGILRYISVSFQRDDINWNSILICSYLYRKSYEKQWAQ